MSQTRENKSWRTAITRKKLSKPAQFLVDTGRLFWGVPLDFGCGKGFDCDTLKIAGYDPFHRDDPSVLRRHYYDTIMCNYVLNVLETEEERNAVLAQINDLLFYCGAAFISVRNDVSNLNGWTSKGTWQGHIKLDLPVIETNSNFTMYVMGANHDGDREGELL